MSKRGHFFLVEDAVTPNPEAAPYGTQGVTVWRASPVELAAQMGLDPEKTPLTNKISHTEYREWDNGG